MINIDSSIKTINVGEVQFAVKNTADDLRTDVLNRAGTKEGEKARVKGESDYVKYVAAKEKLGSKGKVNATEKVNEFEGFFFEENGDARIVAVDSFMPPKVEDTSVFVAECSAEAVRALAYGRGILEASLKNNDLVVAIATLVTHPELTLDTTLNSAAKIEELVVKGLKEGMLEGLVENKPKSLLENLGSVDSLAKMATVIDNESLGRIGLLAEVVEGMKGYGVDDKNGDSFVLLKTRLGDRGNKIIEGVDKIRIENVAGLEEWTRMLKLAEFVNSSEFKGLGDDEKQILMANLAGRALAEANFTKLFDGSAHSSPSAVESHLEKLAKVMAVFEPEAEKYHDYISQTASVDLKDFYHRQLKEMVIDKIVGVKVFGKWNGMLTGEVRKIKLKRDQMVTEPVVVQVDTNKVKSDLPAWLTGAGAVKASKTNVDLLAEPVVLPVKVEVVEAPQSLKQKIGRLLGEFDNDGKFVISKGLAEVERQYLENLIVSINIRELAGNPEPTKSGKSEYSQKSINIIDDKILGLVNKREITGPEIKELVKMRLTRNYMIWHNNKL